MQESIQATQAITVHSYMCIVVVSISLWSWYDSCWHIGMVPVYGFFHGRSWKVRYLMLNLFLGILVFLLSWWWNWSHIVCLLCPLLAQQCFRVYLGCCWSLARHLQAKTENKGSISISLSVWHKYFMMYLKYLVVSHTAIKFSRLLLSNSLLWSINSSSFVKENVTGMEPAHTAHHWILCWASLCSHSLLIILILSLGYPNNVM